MSNNTKIPDLVKVSDELQLGDGIQLENNSDALEVKKSDDSYSIVRGLAPAGDNDFVTKKYFTDNSTAGSVVTINSILPDGAGNVALDLDDIPDGNDYKRVTTAQLSDIALNTTNRHTHSNTTILDAITQPIIDDSHTHSNKSVLDIIEAAFLTVEKTKLSNIAESANNYAHPTSHPASIMTFLFQNF
jgi:hypothetical protein